MIPSVGVVFSVQEGIDPSRCWFLLRAQYFVSQALAKCQKRHRCNASSENLILFPLGFVRKFPHQMTFVDIVFSCNISGSTWRFIMCAGLCRLLLNHKSPSSFPKWLLLPPSQALFLRPNHGTGFDFSFSTTHTSKLLPSIYLLWFERWGRWCLPQSSFWQYTMYKKNLLRNQIQQYSNIIPKRLISQNESFFLWLYQSSSLSEPTG